MTDAIDNHLVQLRETDGPKSLTSVTRPDESRNEESLR